MSVQGVLVQARDPITVKRVYGELSEKNGLTIISAAAGTTGAGGSIGREAAAGSGAGCGVSARPVEAHVIEGDTATWQPAFALDRIIVGGQVVAIVFFLSLRALVKLWRGGK